MTDAITKLAAAARKLIADNDPTARGVPAYADGSPTYYCEHCGQLNTKSARYCTSCESPNPERTREPKGDK